MPRSETARRCSIAVLGLLVPVLSGSAARGHADDDGRRGQRLGSGIYVADETPMKGQKMSEGAMARPFRTVVMGRSEHSPAPGPVDTLKFVLVPGNVPGTPPLMLYGSFNISADTAGRYFDIMPKPILAVAVSRETGRVYIRNLADVDDLPPRYRGDSAPPAVVRHDPGGPSSVGISSSGFFNVDLPRHLTLPGGADVYDVFLWLENMTTDLVTAAKPDEADAAMGGLLYDRPASIAAIQSTPVSDRLELSAAEEDGERHITGRVGTNRVSIVAQAIQSGDIGWTVLNIDAGSGMAFDMKVRDLLPRSAADDRIVAFALVVGRRSPRLDMPARH